MADDPYAPLIDAAGRANNVDPALIRTVFQMETSGGANVANSLPGDPDSPGGLMQIRPSTARAMGQRNPQDAGQVFGAAARYLRQGLDATGSPEGALAYYHGGPDRAQWGPKTAAYVAKGQALYPSMANTAQGAPVAAQAKQAADPDLEAGKAYIQSLASGGGKAAAPVDPDVAAGQDYIKSLTAGAAPAQQAAANDQPPAPQAPGTPAPHEPMQSNALSDLAQIGSNVVSGVKEGFGDAPLGPQGQNANALARLGILPAQGDEGTPVQQFNRLLFQGGDAVLRGGNALLRGGQALVAGAGSYIGQPGLGRDLAAIPEAFVTGDVPGAAAPPAGVAARPNALAAAGDVRALAAPDAGALGNPLAAPIREPATLPGEGAPVPKSAGAAATPSELTAMSPKEAAASQATGENARLLEPPKPGDKTEYVKGVVPTAAEVTGDANVAATQKYISQTPGEMEKFRAQQAANNEARLEHYDTLAGTPTIVNSLSEARAAQADADLAQAWGAKKPVDAQSVVDHIDGVLSGPQGKLSAVSSALGKVRDLLYNSKGELETDPEVLYGARREVDLMLGKAAQTEKPTLKDAAPQLQSVKDALDGVIESGAPGYKQYLDNYSAASRPIDVHELLLDARPNLTTGADRTMTFAKVDRFMKDVVAQRQSRGANAAKSIDDDTMEGLWNLHADLKRANNIDLGKARGSDTSMLGRIGQAGALGAAHAVAGAVAPVVGNFLVSEGRNALNARSAAKQSARYLDGTNFKP